MRQKMLLLPVKYNHSIEQDINMHEDTGLSEDLEFLQSTHAIDDSLIESLQSSPEQAKAHIRFYKRMILLTCILPVIMGCAITALAGLKLSGILTLTICVVGAWIIYHFGYIILKRSKAIRATEQIAKYHHLI